MGFVHPGFPLPRAGRRLGGQFCGFLLALVFDRSGKFRPVGFPPVFFRLLVQVFKGNFCFPVINRGIAVFHAVGINQAAFIVGNENVNLVEVFRPEGEAARIADNDRRARRLLRHFLRVDFLIGEDPEIAAVLRVQAGAAIFVTNQGVVFVPVHRAPAVLCGLAVRFRLAVCLVNRDTGNRRYEIAHFPFLLHGESSLLVCCGQNAV